MSRTTFFTVEVVGPNIPLNACTAGDSRMFRLQERAVTIRAGHRAGAWSRDALERMAALGGVKLTGAYWMNYSARHGYSGAAKHNIF